ncbi:MAG: hypothetical protein GXX04_05860 [Clostridiaceae bacterium]|nr:hypothetical protein [Clostridiaceae bacterium]
MTLLEWTIAAVIILSAALLASLVAHERRLRKLDPFKGQKKMQEGLGPREWEHQMMELARDHLSVKWKSTPFIVGNYNQMAYRKINRIRHIISGAPSGVIALTPSARWLFDNFQMMYREIKKIKTTGTNYLSLPHLKSTEYRGYPRIYVIARKIVEISGGYLHEENIALMIDSYQGICPLTERELAVLPEMLGFCLLERIIDVSGEIIHVIRVKARAEKFVRDRLVDKGGYLDITPLLVKQDEMEADISFHSHVIYLLKNKAVDDAAIARYLAYHFGGEGERVNAAALFKEEGRKASMLESCVRTLITSLRELNRINEEELIERLSIVERILSEDPGGVYPRMDSSSRGQYRMMVEKLAIRYGVNEVDVAKACVALAKEGRDEIFCSRHVGAYLLGKGYPILKAKIRKRPLPEQVRDNRRLKGILYFSLNALILAVLTSFIPYILGLAGYGGEPYRSVLLILVSLPIMIHAARTTADAIITRLIPPQDLPLMDYSEEIPDSARTFLVMPVIISGREQALEYAERLHKHYLANRQHNLYFALLADYADAKGKELPTDREIREALVSRIEQLNRRYPSAHQKFSLFIRERRWNQSEDCYMCWERKRGKLEEFNALLNGVSPEKTSFTTLLCDMDILGTIRYVITLDADSDLVIDNASKLIGMIDHPLNRAHLDPEKKMVSEGYAIIQPLVRNHIYEKNSALFPKIFGGRTGSPNYSVVVSDIYQDLFREGSFVGKGIYDVQAFHQLLYNKIPENCVLSHDLLESCYARTAFASRADIVESFPGSYMSFAKREHRWIRGDWQLLPWLLKKELSFLSRWKISCNMIESLVSVSRLLFIILTIALAPGAYWLWIPVVLFTSIFDLLLLVLGVVIHRIRRPRLALVYSRFFQEIGVKLLKAFLDIVLVPSAAFNAMDAIMTTLYRLTVSKKHLLLWDAADIVEKTARNSLAGYFKMLGTSSLVSCALAAVIPAFSGAVVLPVSSILAVLWGTSFLTAYIISMGGSGSKSREQLDRKGLLHDTARRMWKFFRAFATKENNWLCPDNYQVANVIRVTQKTSPTNIGLQFLSILTARDFGFETLSSFLDYTENLMYTVNVLPKWKGHLYNWYDTCTLEVLEPRYISTVDSGNFFGALIALKNGLLEQLDTPVLNDDLMAQLHLAAGKAGLKATEYSRIGDLINDLGQHLETICHETAGDDSLDPEEIKRLLDLIRDEVENLGMEELPPDERITLSDLAGAGNKYAVSTSERILGLCRTIDNMLEQADFSFLFNRRRMLFHIGYNESIHEPDDGCYDLIASESVLTSYLAIAMGKVPVKHWKKLGRPLAIIKGIPAHVSWSGTMFEYLMPNLLLKEYEGSVFADSNRAAVLQQIRYATHMGIPWGISESQYYRFDINSNYQYRAFGVPKLRLQPSFELPIVVAPYACMLALEYAGNKALDNLERIKALGAYGEYGFYEAIDFSSPDPVLMTNYCIVRSYMAHHQGMSLVAINNYLNGGIIRRRFHAEPMVKAVETLLEEKRETLFVSISRRGYTVDIRKKIIHEDEKMEDRLVKTVAPAIPTVGYYSNGSYSVLVTSDGDGFSSRGGIMVNRWKPDIYAQTGFYIYIQDMEQERVWSSAYNPTRTMPDEYTVAFSHHQAEFRRRDGDISTCTVVTMSSDHDLEIRQVTLKNHGSESRKIQVTSYLEVVADSYMADSSHPAFSKLFIESEYDPEHAVFLSRRRDSGENRNPYIIHMVRTGSGHPGRVEYENDRMRFIGRNNTLAYPDALKKGLSNSAGFSNDPIMSLRVYADLEPEGTAVITFIAGVCKTREEAMKISDEMSVPYRISSIMQTFRRQSEVELKYLGIGSRQLNAFQDAISPLFYPSRFFRGPSESIRRNFKDQNSLWRFGISGDKPIMLLQVNSVEEAEIVRDVLRLYQYLRINRVNADLVILCETKYGYAQELTCLLNSMTSSLRIYDHKDAPGIFIIHSYQLVPAERDLLNTVARIVFSGKTGIYFRSVWIDMRNTQIQG